MDPTATQCQFRCVNNPAEMARIARFSARIMPRRRDGRAQWPTELLTGMPIQGQVRSTPRQRGCTCEYRCSVSMIRVGCSWN
ncbi:hypothetical protein V8C42DRAFT_333931 [Trichoderma barbatum]